MSQESLMLIASALLPALALRLSRIMVVLVDNKEELTSRLAEARLTIEELGRDSTSTQTLGC